MIRKSLVVVGKRVADSPRALVSPLALQMLFKNDEKWRWLVLLSLRQCARYLGISHPMLCNYFLHMQREIPYVNMKGAKLVDPEFIRAKLRATGYRFTLPGTIGTGYYEEIVEDVYGALQLVPIGDEGLTITRNTKLKKVEEV